jgi:hypothetical protein
VVTSILGPILTEYFGRQRLAEQAAAVILPQTAPQASGELSDPDSAGLSNANVNQTKQGAPADEQSD